MMKVIVAETVQFREGLLGRVAPLVLAGAVSVDITSIWNLNWRRGFVVVFEDLMASNCDSISAT